MYPTLARITLDILPARASSVPCECLFLASKQAADNRCAWLGNVKFERFQMLNYAWRNKVVDLAGLNSGAKEQEEIPINAFEDLLEEEEFLAGLHDDS
jgi:hypothetical protein